MLAPLRWTGERIGVIDCAWVMAVGEGMRVTVDRLIGGDDGGEGVGAESVGSGLYSAVRDVLLQADGT